MATTSREVARDALVALLSAALTGAGNPVDTVSGSKVTSLAGAWPLVTVLSAGTERIAMTFQGIRVKSFSFLVQVWVRQTGDSWTLAQSGDALDEIEAAIAEVYEDNMNTADWERLSHDGPTRVWEATEAGTAYYVEDIPTKMELMIN